MGLLFENKWKPPLYSRSILIHTQLTWLVVERENEGTPFGQRAERYRKVK